MNVVEEIRMFVEGECKKGSSNYGYEPYVFHFIPMHRSAKILAEKLGADVEVVELAVWLHDLGSIIHGRKDHHITGAKIAEDKLMEFNYPKDKIDKVKKCILNHRGSVVNRKESIEEQIIADTDVLSAFENIGGLFKAAYVFEGLNQREGMESVRQKLINSYNKLTFLESKEIIKSKYEAAMLLLK